jgi:hypothetical protein
MYLLQQSRRRMNLTTLNDDPKREIDKYLAIKLEYTVELTLLVQ